MKNPFIKLLKYSPTSDVKTTVQRPVIINVNQITHMFAIEALNDCGQWRGDWVTKICFQGGYHVVVCQNLDTVTEKINDTHWS